MYNLLRFRYWIVIAITSAFIGIFSTPNHILAQAPSPFLIPPYYGQKPITSYFDHQSPTQQQNNNVRYYNGRSGTNANCDPNFARAYSDATGCMYYDGHEGIDFGSYDPNQVYTPVLAADSGTIEAAQWTNTSDRTSGLGLYVRIRHTVNNVNYYTLYGHLSSVAVSVNQLVQQGQIIGTVGSTGSSTAAHLHFEVRNTNEQRIDPFGWSGSGSDPWGATSYCLWKDGEWANTPNCGGVSRPIPQPVDGGQTIQIADTTNNSGGFTKGYGGLWQNQCTDNCSGNWARNGTWYYYANVNGSTVNHWAKWQPSTIPSGGGIYEIYAYIPGTYATSWQVPYTIRNNAGTILASVIVDQKGVPNKWISLGIYYLDQGSNVYVTDATREALGAYCGINVYCQFSADDLMFVRRGTTYAPEVRNSNGWLSTVTLRNNGGGAAKYLFKCLNNVGTSVYSTVGTLNPHETYNPVCLVGGYTSVVVDATQDVSVLVEHEKNNRTERSNYSGIIPVPTANGIATPIANWDTTGTTLYAPVVKNNYYGVNTYIFVQNAGTQNTTLNATYYNDSGAVSGTPVALPTLAPGGKTLLLPDSCLHLLCNAKITTNNGQPLAAVIEESKTSDGNRASSHNAMSVGSTTLYIPVFKDQWYNISSGVRVQNVSGSSANLTFTFYRMNGSTKCTINRSVNAYGSTTFWDEYVSCPHEPGGVLGSAIVTSNQPIVAQFNEVSLDWRIQSSANALFRGNRIAYGPLAYYNYAESGQTWIAGVAVQNTTGQNANVTVRFYTTGGALFGTPVTGVVSPHALGSFFAPVANFKGSVIVFADQDVVTTVNVINYSPTGDPYANYNAISR